MIRVVLLFFGLSILGQTSVCNGADISLSFSNFSASKRDHVDAVTVLAPNSTVKIMVVDMPLDIDFLIVQAHAHVYDVVLSFEPYILPENHANGSNVGLYSQNHGSPIVMYLKNPHPFNVTTMVAAVPYTNESPIPGGCNLEAPLPIKPYLSLDLSPAMVTVDGSPASNLNGYENCDVNLFAYLMFYKFLPERDFTPDTYFDGIRSMLTYPRILNSSYVAPEPIGGPALRRVFNKYSGTGTVYSLIAFNKYGNVAVYTPSFTYACEDALNGTPCQLTSTGILKVEFALLMTISAFICFAGHRYFLGELFFMGAIAGGLISYLLFLMQGTYTGDLMLMITGIGVISGAVWVCVWWFVSSPILSVSLPFLINGFLTTATVFYFLMYGFTLLQSDLNYWLTFIVFLFLTFLLSTTNPVKFNMLACSFVGAYGFLLPLDYYIGSNLKYILLNVIRRATVEGFNLAATKAPLQLADGALGVIWIIFTFGGYRCQKKLSANRSPFPPVCILLREPDPEETVPIVTNARFPTYT